MIYFIPEIPIRIQIPTIGGADFEIFRKEISRFRSHVPYYPIDFVNIDSVEFVTVKRIICTVFFNYMFYEVSVFYTIYILAILWLVIFISLYSQNLLVMVPDIHEVCVIFSVPSIPKFSAHANLSTHVLLRFLTLRNTSSKKKKIKKAKSATDGANRGDSNTH